MRKLSLLAAFAVFAVQVMTAGGDRPQVIEPGIDTMPPVLTMQSLPCGVRDFTATEKRNIPDPPRATPNERDQVERGIQSIRLALDPQAQNVRLQNLNPTLFPKEQKVAEATFQIALIDPSKPGSCVVEVRDWNNNLTTRQVTISAATPTISAAAVNFGTIKVGAPAGTQNVTVTNNTDGPMTLTGITLATGTRFSIAAGGNTPVNLQIGGSHTIVLNYNPAIGSENGDSDVLTVTTACGNVTSALSGTGGVSRIQSTDVLTYSTTALGAQDCDANEGKLTVSNTGNFPLVVTSLTVGGADAAKFTVNITSPVLPVTIPAGGQQEFETICFSSDAGGSFTATITVNSDAVDASDNTVTVNGSTNTTSVEDEIGKAARVWFDAANDQIVFNTVAANTPVLIFDMSGRVLATATATEAGNFRISTASWTSGVVMISYSDNNGPRTRTLSVVR